MRILFVNYTMNIGGIESFLLNITKELKNDENDIDFLCYKKEKFDLENDLLQIGCNIYKIDNPEKISFIKHFKQVHSFLKKNKYDIVHCNTYTNSGYVMLAAYFAKVKVRVTHSHTSQKPTTNKQKIKWTIAKLLISKFSNKKIACSKVAGNSLFIDKKYEILENGVDLSKYTFNPITRKDIRKKLLIDNKEIVIGHVGRFAIVKNHKYIINIFKKLNNNYKLLLIGDGPEMKKIKEEVYKNKLEDRVIFTGSIRNTNEYFNAIDLILFPSFYEGLPVSLVEAQMNGLQIIASDKISNEINLFGNVHFFNLNDPDDKVINMIYSIENIRNNNIDYFKKSNFNIKNTKNKLIDIYNN